MVIKTLENLENPFSDFGSIVSGERFIGRHHEIEILHERVLSRNYGNIAIVGLPRVGKSSLVWQSIMLTKEKLINNKNLIIHLNVGTINNSKTLYESIIKKIYIELKRISPAFLINNNFDDLLKGNFDFFEIQTLFFQLKTEGFKTILILDEFDHVSNYLKLEDFQFIRELSISPETKTCLITISRRTLKEIEKENGGISNFYGVFKELNLSLFNKTDIEEYWNKFSSFGLEFSNEYKSSVCYKVGNHPFLMDFYNFEIFNRLKRLGIDNKKTDLEEIENEIKLPLYQNFENMLNLLKQQELESKVIQIVLGPVYDLTVLDTEKLIKYDFIKKVSLDEKSQILGNCFGVQTNDQRGYICFSKYFTQYLLFRVNNTPFWPLWRTTEINLRNLLKYYVKQKYGTNWVEKFIQNNSRKNIDEFIERITQIKNYSIKNFGELANKDLIDYIYPKDIYYYFVSIDWAWFKNVFNGEQYIWEKRFKLLSDIRNPVAHNNIEIINKETLDEAKSICHIINNNVSKYLNNSF